MMSRLYGPRGWTIIAICALAMDLIWGYTGIL